MDRAVSDNMPFVSRHISVTPKQLRAIADKLESATDLGSIVKGQVVYELLPGVTIYYDPTLDKFSRDKISSQVVAQ